MKTASRHPPNIYDTDMTPRAIGWGVARIGINALTVRTTRRACRDCRSPFNSRIDYIAVDILVVSYCRPLHNFLFHLFPSSLTGDIEEMFASLCLPSFLSNDHRNRTSLSIHYPPSPVSKCNRYCSRQKVDFYSVTPSL
jgi:hypothetical protein